MRREILTVLALAPLLAACGGSGAPVKSAGAAPPQRQRTAYLQGVRTPTKAPPTARVLNLPGLESVIGSTAADLRRQFGTPRLDVIEGDARKLQFSGGACVLDVFLYPPAAGREPQATYLDARRASDGKDVDRVGCVTALRQPASGAPGG